MILIVDLDGTLIKSDMLYESFWSAFSVNLYVPFKAALKLLSGRAALKSYLVSEAEVDIASLPYDDTVLKLIKKHRSQGGKVALVTAANQLLADKIADHLKIFDEVHGSNNDVNLKGQEKANFLVKRFGRENFCYIGDAPADLPVWKASGKVITVNASSVLKNRIAALNKPCEHLKTSHFSWYSFLRALRPHQWLKNILVFFPMLAAQRFDEISLVSSLFAFIAICFVASSVYIMNDLLDLNADRAHLKKRCRPFASGAIPLAYGHFLLIVLLSVGITIASFINWNFLLSVIIYFVFTLGYSLKLKRKIIIDICFLSGLYTLRIIAGGVATNIDLSVWLLAFSVFFFLSLAAVKRQTELVSLAQQRKREITGRGYITEDLPIVSMISITAGNISVLVMILYLNSPNVLELYKTPQLLWGICCVLIYWINRIVLLSHRGLMHHDPVIFAATDRISQICFIAVVCFLISGVLV